MASGALHLRPLKTPKNVSKLNEPEIETSLIDQNEDVKTQTKAKFDELLKQAVDLHPHKSKKTKKQRTDESKTLESLRRGDGLRKPEDKRLLENTFDPAEEKNLKNGKHQTLIENQDTILKINETSTNNEKPTKKIRKKKLPPEKRPEKNIEDSVNENESKPGTAEPTKITKNKDLGTTAEIIDEQTNRPKKTRRKKKENLEEVNLKESTTESIAETHIKPVKLKKKRPQKNIESQNVIDETVKANEDNEETHHVGGETESPAEPVAMPIQDDGFIIGVNVHKTDKLKTDYIIAHPLVRVSVIDLKTGNYLKKQTRDRCVSSYYEDQNENMDFILPIMTKPFDFKLHRSILPVWEEMIVFNENFNYIIQDDPSVIIFFEVLDILNMNLASYRKDSHKTDGGWHKIAWAFLKMVGNTKKPNIEKRVRLQLYHPVQLNNSLKRSTQPEIYHWWCSKRRVPYPSTLSVTVKQITKPDETSAASRSMFSTQQEHGKFTYDDLQKTLTTRSTTQNPDEERNPTLWSRLAGQVCKIPNHLEGSLFTGTNGCFTLKFSHNGKSLACGGQDKDSYPIYIYEIPTGQLICRLSGHQGIIYELSWSNNSQYLLSASSDGTARIWNVNSSSNNLEKTLPHPSFVYCAKYHIKVNKVVVTGCFDAVIRVWSVIMDASQPQLLQELDDHKSHINSICFDVDGFKMFSADNIGMIRVWNSFTTDRPSKNGVDRNWTHAEDIDLPELKGVAINTLIAHPNGRKLIVQSRDNIPRTLDLKGKVVRHKFIGALNFRDHLRGCVTPCGSFLFTGSEDSIVYVWNIENGDQVAKYTDLWYSGSISCVDYHPLDHLVTFCCPGNNHQVLLYSYDHAVALKDAGVYPDDDLSESQPVHSRSPEILIATEKEGENFETDESMMAYTREEFRRQETSRFEKITRKLQSVTAFNSLLQSQPVYGSSDTDGYSINNETRGSTPSGYPFINQSSFQTLDRSMTATPADFSPHATRTLNNSMYQQAFASRSQYLKDGWRPGFSEVGIHGRKIANNFRDSGKLDFDMSHGRAEFSFRGNQANLTKEQVVCLYDYQAQRSDELSLSEGEKINVLYKDNENWWMGENQNGIQGFFPANYVQNVSYTIDQDSSRINTEADMDSDFSQKRVSAYVSKNGDLQFLSNNEETEDEMSSRRKNRYKKASHTVVSLASEEKTPRSRRHQRRETDQQDSTV